MRTADQVHVVFLEESRDNVRPKGERHATVVLAPACDILVRIGPQKIAEQAAIRNLRTSKVSRASAIDKGEHGAAR